MTFRAEEQTLIPMHSEDRLEIVFIVAINRDSWLQGSHKAL